MDHFCYLCFMFVMLSCLINAALWSPAGRMDLLDLVYGALLCFSLSLWCLWSSVYFILLIPDLCLLTYFHA